MARIRLGPPTDPKVNPHASANRARSFVSHEGQLHDLKVISVQHLREHSVTSIVVKVKITVILINYPHMRDIADTFVLH